MTRPTPSIPQASPRKEADGANVPAIPNTAPTARPVAASTLNPHSLIKPYSYEAGLTSTKRSLRLREPVRHPHLRNIFVAAVRCFCACSRLGSSILRASSGSRSASNRAILVLAAGTLHLNLARAGLATVGTVGRP